MKRVVWLTDIHLNFLSRDQIAAFLDEVMAGDPDTILISGDIGEARTVVPYLRTLAARCQRPIYFVLGNHDFYHGAFWSVYADVEALIGESEQLTWLTRAGVIELTPSTGLVGHDSWADGRCGNYQKSTMLLNDHLIIEELAFLNKARRLQKLNALGDAAASYFAEVLPSAFATYQHVILVTHVPPFRDACWHEGQISDDDFLPHFVCKAVGQVLQEVMTARPDRKLTVLCGHTHGQGWAQILDNLLVLTGGAEYGQPTVQRVFELA